MKLQFFTGLAFIIILSACKKESGIDKSSDNETTYLLSGIVINSDTTHFEYNSNNQLIKWVSGNITRADSFVYDANDRLISCLYRYRSNVDSPPNIYITCSYNNNIILRTETIPSNNLYSYAEKYTLQNDQIVTSEMGGIYGGITTFYGRDSTSYIYVDSNIVKSTYPFVSLNYQPVDTFTYNTQFKNPYLMLGKHVWTLMRGRGVFGTDDLESGESKNMPGVKRRSTQGTSDSTLIFSGTAIDQMIVLEGAQENKLLPKVVKRIPYPGTEVIIRFIYKEAK